MDVFYLNCPDCGSRRPAKPKMIGRAVRCECGARFIVADPQATTIAAECRNRSRRHLLVTVSLLSAVAGGIAGLNSVLRMATAATVTTSEATTEPSDAAEIKRLTQEVEAMRARLARLESIYIE